MIIKTQRGRGKKIHILLDEEYIVTTDADFWARHSIPDGTEISETQWEELFAEISYRKAIQKAADFLSRRDHSRQELLQKLMRSFERPVAERAVERMDELGYLDDEKYARSMLAHLIEAKHFSISRAKRDLAQRGVPREVIDSLPFEEAAPDPVEQITALLETKYARRLQDEKGRRLTVNALQRLGYSYGDIRSALSRFLCEFDEYED